MQNFIGREATYIYVVKKTDLATHWQNNIEVLATPILLWLSELACMKCIEDHLPHGFMTVGTAHNMKHLAPTPEGFKVFIKATLIEANKSKLTFLIDGHDGNEKIIEGNHVRHMVDAGNFINRIHEKNAISQLIKEPMIHRDISSDLLLETSPTEYFARAILEWEAA